ncbi:nuclear transport factor 2 family protein [uncultured Gimesia sp.]|uniref:YybH family protein n=1 Tax=uncultured Gimesia sp. TaxID=1678688 RepID=UPI0030D9CD77
MKLQLICAAMIVFSAVSFNCQKTASASEQDQAEVCAAAQQFYTALNQLFTGEVACMKEVWSHQDDVTFMGPDGSYLHGWKPVLAEWEKTAALKLGGKVEPTEMRIIAGEEIAVLTNYEIGQNIGPDGKVEKVKIRATSTFRKENGEWKMIGHHTDLLPFLTK